VDELTVRVIEIIRGTTHDGPGMRTTVFLKGCPLRCEWCQNPEGMNPQSEVWWESHTCIRCLACLEACPSDALNADQNGLRRDRQRCTRCGACVDACPSQAMSFNSRDWTIHALVKEALKDRDYYQAFDGGVTLSGGEPLSQYKGVAELFKRLHDVGIHTALDTCGLAPAPAFPAVLPHTDHVLFDMKLRDPYRHHAVTGQSNETILANLVSIADYIRHVNHGKTSKTGSGMKLWVRTPLIPDITAKPENIVAISQFIRDDLLDVVERWELCAFNSACRSKYERMGLLWGYAEKPLMRQSEIDALKEAALSTGLAAGNVVVSGLIATG